MPVFTKKDYEKKLKLKEKNFAREKTLSGASPLKDLSAVKKEQEIKTYVLLHPDNPMEVSLNFEDELELDGVKYKRECKNGIVRTKDIPLYLFLKKKGWEILEIRSANDELADRR